MWYNSRLHQKKWLVSPLSLGSKGSLGSVLQALFQVRWGIHNPRLLWVGYVSTQFWKEGEITLHISLLFWLTLWVKKKWCICLSSYASCRSLELLKLFMSLESTNCHLTCLHSKRNYSYLAVIYASKSKSTTKFMIFDTSIQKFRAITYSIFKHGEFNIF